MDWREALRSRATGLAGGRVYWDERPQTSALPGLVMTVVSDGRPQHLKGFEDLMPGRVQFDSYGKTPAEAWALMDAVIALLVPGGTANGHTFQRADVEIPPRSLTERVGSITVFRVSMDLTFHHALNEEGS
jgi:hypothetical protein